jgi:hypothetical protein
MVHATGVPHLDPWLAEHGTRCLWSGESLQGAFPMELDVLVPETLPKQYRRAKPEANEEARLKGGWRLLNPLVGIMWLVSIPAGLVEWAGTGTWRGFRRLFRGQTWSGGWESTAGRFICAVRTGPMNITGYDNKKFALVLTDRRLLLMNIPTHPEREAAQLLTELPRGQFGRRREPHPRRHGSRVDIAFPDSSWVALHAERRAQVDEIAALLD